MKNASSVHVGLRIPAQIFEAVKTAYPNFGWSKIVRDALVEKLGRDKGITFDDSVLCMSQGSRNDLPNRVTEAEKRARKGLRPRGRPRKSELVAIENLEKRARKEFAALARAFGKTPAEAKALAEAALPRGKAVREARKPADAPDRAPRSRRAA